MLAATPDWFAENLTQIAVGTLLVLAVLVIRMVQKAMVRMVLLGLFAGLALFVYANRVPLEACASTCECRLVGQDVTVPACNADLNL